MVEESRARIESSRADARARDTHASRFAMLSQLGDIVGERVAALAPKADFSLGDVIDEVHKLREENAALKAQIAILSVAADGVSPMPVIKPLASTSTAAAATERCLTAEVARLEASVEAARLQGVLDREALALRCDELGRALEQRVLQAERAQHEAVAHARQASREQVEALEEQLAALAEEAAQHEALSDAYGAEARLEAAEQRAAEWSHRCERKAAECEQLRSELESARASHAEKLRAAESAAAASAAEADGRRDAVQKATSVKLQLESQLVRLSEGFNKQVEEVLSVQRLLERTRQSSIDKATARSWVVNFVEATIGRQHRHADELLQLMSEWWEFTREDLQRVGLSADPHPTREAALTPSASSLSDAFATFLDDESAKAAMAQRGGDAAAASRRGALPPPRSPVRVADSPAMPAVEPPEARSLLVAQTPVGR